jgi:hypothetical protein
MASMLLKRFNFFELGENEDYMMDERPNQYPSEKGVVSFTCRQLYSSGQVVFITPEVMEKQAGKALRIVEHLAKHNNTYPNSWRLFTRPGVREWLGELADQHHNSEHVEGNQLEGNKL